MLGVLLETWSLGGGDLQQLIGGGEKSITMYIHCLFLDTYYTYAAPELMMRMKDFINLLL